MKTPYLKNLKQPCFKRRTRSNLLFLALPLLCSFLIFTSTSRALTLNWDATAGTGANDGSGNWYAPNVWWNATGGTNYTWTGSGDQETVIFGAGSGAIGNYVVTNNAALAQPFSLIFNAPGSYTITTDGVNVGSLSIITNGGGVGTGAYAPGFYAAANVTAVINVPIRLVGTCDIAGGSNSVLTFGQGTTANTQQPFVFKGAGPAFTTINATNGSFGTISTGNSQGTSTADGVTLNITGTAIFNTGSRFDIARSGPPTGAAVANAVVNVGGVGANAQLNANVSGGNNTGNHLQISRGAPATLNLFSGGLISTLGMGAALSPSGNIRIVPDSASQGSLNISGGTLLAGVGPSGGVGVSSVGLTLITLFDATTAGSTASAVLSVSGGTVTAKGITIGSGSAMSAGATNKITITGGIVYLDSGNIVINTPTGTSGANYGCNLSGGTLAATANWSTACKIPMNLGNLNGNITFQAADANGTAQNMAISGSLTGIGGFIKTGAGSLTLTGTNTYAGTTVISNGTLIVSTLNSPANGAVTVEAGTVSTAVANVGQRWAIGNLTYDSGTPTADFNYGNFTPSTTVAPVQVSGNLTYTVTPQITIEGSAIPTGTYPLIQYTGTLSGTPPNSASITLSGGSASGYVTNFTATGTIALVVTTSTYNPALSWGVGNGLWDFASLNWNQFGSPIHYNDGAAVLFDDTATGTTPINISLNTAVSPSSVTVNNTAKNYAVSGNSSIAGNTSLVKDGAGTLTLSGTNTYHGGTTVNAGQLNLNYGGDGAINSAIGTGPLTINFGAAIDNTSGQAVTLVTPIAENWVDDFTFVGSTNLNLGSGQVKLGSGTVLLTVSSNVLEVDGSITDNGLGYGLSKTGNGTLVLSNYNNFSGGLTLTAGTLDINSYGADGSGLFTLNGGTLDNTSGNPISLTSSSVKWQNSFIFNGSAPIDLGTAPLNVGNVTVTVNSNTLSTEGILMGANNTLTKGGAGTLTLGGSYNNTAFNLVINGGVVNFNKDQFGNALPSNPVTVNTNGTLVMLNPVGTQMGPTASLILFGGVVEMNGDSETFPSVTFNSGILRNSSGAAALTLSSGVSLAGTNCDFDLTNNASLAINAIITNTGSLLQTGNGTLLLSSNNTYTGSTVITGGTLALNGSISNSVLINVRDSAILDVTGLGGQTLTLNAGQTLSGKGTLNGSLVVAAGSTFAPGGALTTGTFSVNNNVTLNGNLLLNLNRTNAPTSSQFTASGTTTYGGTLLVTNVGAALQVGDTFNLFPAAVTAFAGINLITTDATGNVYTWINHVTTDGSIQVASVAPAINPNPGTIQFSVSGGSLNLAWPTNAGWLLQTQTNSLNTGLSTNWVTLPGSGSATSTNMAIDPASGAVFYRLIHP